MMNRSRLQRLSRKWHRVLGPLIGVQLLFWTLGGIYFSWFDLDDVHGDYERTGTAAVDLLGTRGIVPIDTLLERSALSRVEAIRIGRYRDRVVVRLYGSDDRAEMYDAASGDRLSPISEAEARGIAEADFAPDAEVTTVRLIEAARGEYKKALPAYRVDFDNWKQTHIYVNADTGLIMARRNAIWRGFDFLWMLHILDFREREDFNNWLLRAMSLLGLFTVVSGYTLWGLTTPLLRRRAAAKHPDP